jgi:DNA-directed RNA polymerase specialized sigma24 family protein
MTGNPSDVRNERREDAASAAVTGLFRSHHLELVRLALLMTGDLAAAEDVVQDAFEHRTAAGPASGSRAAARPTSGPAC